MKERFLIIADDFTGANDTGVQLRRRGNAVQVMFSTDTMAACEDSIVIDTESRSMEEKEAYNHTKKLVSNLDFGQFQYVIKKVDSTLRGNVAEEIAAADACFHSELIIFAPSLPDLNRTTVGQIHRLKGMPITETEMAYDPKKPVTEDNVKKLLEKVFDEKVAHYSLDEVRSGFEIGDARVCSFDSETNDDLIKIIKTAQATGKKILWVGTAAIADNIMNCIEKTLPSFAVCASINSTTSAQIKAAEAAGIALVQVMIPELLRGELKASKYVEECVSVLNAGKDVILLSSATYEMSEVDRSMDAGEPLGMDLVAISTFTQKVIGEIANAVMKQVQISGVFLTGGDTAISFLKELKAKGSSIISEIAIGIPMMKIVGGDYDGMKVITKSGAFGNKDAIILSLKKLKEK